MKIVLRGTRLTLVMALCLCIFAFSSVAQEDASDDGLTVAGSALVVENIVNQALDFSGISLDATLNITGTTNGLAAFCAGDATIAGATRPLTVEEEAICNANGVTFAEYLLGYDTMAVIAHPDLTFVECLTTNNLNNIFTPSAQADVTTWADASLADATDTPVSVFLPATNSSTYALLDNLVDGFGLRADATVATEDIVAQVSNTPGAIGVTTLNTASAAEGVTLVELNTTELNTCAQPTTETIDSGEYGAANRLLLYVNMDASGDENLQSLLSYLVSEDGNAIAVNSGFTAPSADSVALNQSILAGEAEIGRNFSRDVVAFEIPGDVIGSLTIGGTADAVTYINSVTGAFSRSYPSVTVNVNTLGESRDGAAFCNGTGTVDILTTSTMLDAINVTVSETVEVDPLDAEATAEPDAEATETPDSEDPTEAQPTTVALTENCANNEVDPIMFEIGTRAAVLIGNATADFWGDEVCLTTDEVISIWGATATDTITTWDAVFDDADAVDLFTFAPPLGTSRYADLLLAQDSGPVLPMRSDVTEQNPDALYRAAAVANAPGTIAFMGWDEYLEIPEEQLAAIQLIAINNGESCVTPSTETITDGSYPYVETTRVVFDNNQLGNTALQSLIWFMFSDENFELIENAGYTGVTAGDLPAIREQLQALYDAAPAPEPVAPDAPPFASDAPSINPLATPIAPPSGE